MSPHRHPFYDNPGFTSRRSAVHSSKGIVSCTQPLAAQCGIRILEKGGNCADAAVAVAAAMNLTEPCSTGIGGDMFCLFYDAETKSVKAINGSGRSAASLDVDAVRSGLGVSKDTNCRLPPRDIHTVTVPGAAAGWVDTVENFGSGKLSMEDILLPAIELAEFGYPVSEVTAAKWQRDEHHLKTASPNYAEMLKHDPNAESGCRAPMSGEIMHNPALARTFRDLAKHGKSGFYTGRVAEEIIKVLQPKGSSLTLDDLKWHMDQGPGQTEPISLKFTGQNMICSHDKTLSDGVELWEHAPNGQGLVALMALGIIQVLQKQGKIKTFTSADHNSPEYIHVIIEALRLAFADGAWYVSDPTKQSLPTRELLSEEYLTERANLFDPTRASAIPTHGSPALSSSDTVYFAVTDQSGNAISFINSNFMGFGSFVIPSGCGFTLQNRGHGFVLGPESHPNVLAPRKRPYHTIIPAMITKVSDRSLHAVYGVMGGYMQPQGHVQVLLNMLLDEYDDEGRGRGKVMNPQTALDAPRVVISGDEHDRYPEPDVVVGVEDGVPEATVAALRDLGHRVEVISGPRRSRFGRGQIILRVVDAVDGRASWTAGSDPRGDGCAVPLI